MKRKALMAAVAGGAVLATAATALGATDGAGATFPRIAYQTWCQDSNLCSYTGIGSTGGINNFINGTVDFGASDAPLRPDQVSDLASKRGGVNVLYFPTLVGAVTVPTNFSGQSKRIQLTGSTIGKIFSGTISNWNDPQIKKENPGVSFPNAPITTCVRSDGSGTSYQFSLFLSKASSDFKSKVGASQLPAWSAPNVIKSNGNPGVATCVSNNTNSIGYVDLADAQNAGLTDKMAAVGKSEVVGVKKKVHGKTRTVLVRRTAYVLPSVASMSAAGNVKASKFPANLQVDLTLSPVPRAYPITSTTWILAYSDFGKAGKSGSLAGVKSVLNYFYSSAAQAKLPSMGYAPLPKPLLALAKSRVAALK